MDRKLGDPRRWHPVAGFGTIAGTAETLLYAPSRRRGVAAEAVLVCGTVGLATLATKLPPSVRIPLHVGAAWAVLGGRSLEREGEVIESLLANGELDAARHRLRNLVGRDATGLSADEVARACVESLAENSADAVVAPLFWGAVGGLPGLVTYRAINTLDAMWGHRSQRYRHFGWAAARVDDAANWLPARFTVGLTAVLAGRRAGEVIRIVRRDAHQHPSPNAGPVESAWAAQLGVQLGGTNTYEDVVEDRGRLGDGAPVTTATITPARDLLRQLSWLALAAVAAARYTAPWAIRLATRAAGPPLAAIRR